MTPESLLRTTLFTAGYLLVWVLVGLVVWILFEGVRSLDLSFLGWDDGGRYVAGAVIASAALYELTPLKRTCCGTAATASCWSPTGGRARPGRSAWAWTRAPTASAPRGR